ncbi:MAG: undecaprenyl/decaprenyl-phosphate alpha-N-acetylglucosaminyl 1-phosphate transferase, partial [Bacteroidaceae bacterium]
MWKINIILSFVISLGITWFVIPKILLISFKKKLFDFVDDRKVHEGVVPRLGGVAFMPSIVLTFALLIGLNSSIVSGFTNVTMFASPYLSMMLCCLLILYLEGI